MVSLRQGTGEGRRTAFSTTPSPGVPVWHTSGRMRRGASGGRVPVARRSGRRCRPAVMAAAS